MAQVRSPDETVVSGTQETRGMTNFEGISTETVGARNIYAARSVIPPGAKAEAHHHIDFETGIYVLEGGPIRLYTGRGLEDYVDAQKGDFLYIPPDEIHQPENLSEDEPAVALVIRDVQEETVVNYDPETDTLEEVTQDDVRESVAETDEDLRG